MAFFRGDGGAGTADLTNTPINIAQGGTGASTATAARANLGVSSTGSDTTYAFRSNNLSDLTSASTARTNLGLGTAATTNSTAYATAAQGALADSATQPGDLATVATSGDYDDLINKPTLGTAAATDATDYATAAQGSTADSAVQPGDLATVATSGDYDDLINTPSIPASLTDLGISDGSNGQVLTTNGAGTFTFTTSGTGTVTSVAASVPTGLAISGSPITTSGTLAITYDTGYAIPTTSSQSNWDTAYGWGDHSTEGYLTSYTETDPVVGAVTGIVKADGAGNITAAVAGTDYLATETYLGTVTSVDISVPTGLTVSGNPITSSGTLAVTYDTGYAIPTTASQSNWDTAYGWGDHAAAGYLDSADIGVTVQAYDATIVVDADIGVTVQGYDADTAKYDDVTANFTGTLQNGGNTVLTTASTIEGGTYS
jgi:hypothetical protein